jgi:ABC-2 type transport system permease protein
MTVLAIAQRELQAIFATSVGWLVLTGFLLVTGVFWLAGFQYYVSASMDLVFNPYTSTNMNFNDHLLSPFFGNTTVILVMVCPALSMRVFAEEYRQHTMELLYTSPVTSGQIVLGKFLGTMAFVSVLCLCTLHLPLSLYAWGSPDLAAVASGYLGLLLLSAALVSMGLLFSSMTDNQLVAMVLTFTTSLALWIMPWVRSEPDDPIALISFLPHLRELISGAVRVSDLTYFAGFIFLFLFATHQRVESHRWS